MAKQHLPAINFMRGIGMLGVISIHTGAYSLSNPLVNVHLFALLEIASRFCVPIFFFVSSFGLFLNQNLSQPFSYIQFLQKRMKSVLIPYLSWSVVYMVYTAFTNNPPPVWSLDSIFFQIFFGLAAYHLYFLVILLWFYLLMPL